MSISPPPFSTFGCSSRESHHLFKGLLYMCAESAHYTQLRRGREGDIAFEKKGW